MKKSRAFLFFLACVALSQGLAFGVDTADTKFLTQPDISTDRIVFVYANDLWTADLDGRNVRRLTSDTGAEFSPVFSPDGKMVAFSGQYDGNMDVFVVPAEGGVPRRLTWHPGSDLVQDFTPDGSEVLFTSSRDSAVRSYLGLYAVPIEGGFPMKHPIPYVSRAALSPDGKYIAYNPFREAFLQWKNYRGGTNSRVWIFNNADQTIEKVPQPEGRCNDAGPMWLDGKVYFRSDRNGEFNLFSYDRTSREVKQLTAFEDFPVLSASSGSGRIIFEQAGVLHLFDPQNGKSGKITVGIATDLPEIRERYASGSRWIRNANLSPSGARAVFEFRGEIVTVPAEKGDPRNITETLGVHERSPVWSPDGKLIAYFSDKGGEYALYVRSQDGKGEGKAYELPGAGFYGSPNWSPDSEKIAYADNALALYWIDLGTGKTTKVAAEPIYGPGRIADLVSDWSPDSKWLTYTLITGTYFRQVFVYSLEENKSYPITDGLSDVSEPIFDPSGKYLYFFASTDAGPVRQWFDMSNADMRMTNAIYLAVLRKDLPNPLAKESDEETPGEKKEAARAPSPGRKGDDEKKTASEAAGADETFRIDFDGLGHRIVALPVQAGAYVNLQVGDTGKIYYQEFSSAGRGFGGQSSLHLYDLKTRKDEVLLQNINAYILSADNTKMLTSSRNAWSIVPAVGKPQPDQGRLNLDAISVRVAPLIEWKQIFDEAWRINRDFFYDPHFHGADWPAMKKKYAAFLPDVSCRDDLNRLIQWMCSELAVGHHRGGGGDSPFTPNRIGGGLLGADFAIDNGRYRFQKVYGGLNWNPELRSPLTEPGVDVKAGEYLIAVEGLDLRPPENLFSRFENAEGKIVEITVGPHPDGRDSRTVQVVPVASDSSLRNRDWVEGNIQKVHKATDGRVAYVYVPNTSTMGHIYFKRYFFPQADKDAIIVDERFNGGGSVADYYIDWLRKPLVSYWAMRYGADIRTPSAYIPGPKVMLINESAGSGGDLLPWMWRKFGLGPLVGTRTWGGLVGVLGFPVLMDGGSITAPNLAIWTEDGFIVENVGVPPDIEVEQTPKDVIAGHDPQLELAIKIVLEGLDQNPVVTPKRPPFPIRVRK